MGQGAKVWELLLEERKGAKESQGGVQRVWEVRRSESAHPSSYLYCVHPMSCSTILGTQSTGVWRRTVTVWWNLGGVISWCSRGPSDTQGQLEPRWGRMSVSGRGDAGVSLADEAACRCRRYMQWDTRPVESLG